MSRYRVALCIQDDPYLRDGDFVELETAFIAPELIVHHEHPVAYMGRLWASRQCEAIPAGRAGNKEPRANRGLPNCSASGG